MFQGHFEDSDWLPATSSPSLCPQSLHALPRLFSFVQTSEVYQGLSETGIRSNPAWSSPDRTFSRELPPQF